MSQEISIVAPSNFVVSRTSRSGKVTKRNPLGVNMSGNRAEHNQLASLMAKRLIANNTFAPVMEELSRVFPPSTLKNSGVYQVGDAYAIVVDKTIYQLDKWDTATATAYCNAITAKVDAITAKGTEVKGEKQLAYGFALELLRHVTAKEAAKAAALESQAA